MYISFLDHIIAFHLKDLKYLSQRYSFLSKRALSIFFHSKFLALYKRNYEFINFIISKIDISNKNKDNYSLF